MDRVPSDRAGLPEPLRAVFATHAEARRRGMPVAEVAGERAEQQLSRRQLLGTAGAIAAATVPAGLLAPSRAAAAAPTAPRVVIVGAGLAGLRCAHQLWNRGTPIASTVYEADTTHLGGRCWSLRGFFAGGQVSEHGGSFISSTDKAVLNLANSLGLQREYANGGALDSGDYAGWVNGSLYNGSQQQDDWIADAFDAFSASYRAIGTPRYDNYTAEAHRLDQLSCLDYLAEIGLPADSRLGQLIQALQLQSGGEPGQSSALNMIGFLGGSSIFAGGRGFDEKYHLVGGNDQLVTGMVGRPPAARSGRGTS
ncbi:flavin monoamine oxidase family protein [Kitasatospora gansuensis]